MRVNPDIDAKSHPHISTGLKTNKFGVAIDDAREMCLRMRGRSGVQIVGLHSHVGSQITELEPLRRAAEALVALAARAARRRHRRRAPRHRRRARHLLRRPARADRGGVRGERAADRPRERPRSDPRAGTVSRRTGRRARRQSGRHQAAGGRQAVRDRRRRHDRADAPDALRRLPPHRARPGGRSSRRPSATSSDRSARRPTRLARTAACPARRSATCWWCSTPARTAP